MALFFNFGEEVEAFSFKVINEREARASAGLMFLFGLLSLFTVPLLKTLFWVELFSITFIVEFFIRIVFSPKYAPYMILGSLFVYNQEAEWVEAKPKQFAWILGSILGLIMSYYILFDIVNPFRIIICILCLILLFLESSFGICLGCILYRKLNIKLEKCPGGVCEVNKRVEYDKKRLLLLALFLGLFIFTFWGLKNHKYVDAPKVIIIEDA